MWWFRLNVANEHDLHSEKMSKFETLFSFFVQNVSLKTGILKMV